METITPLNNTPSDPANPGAGNWGSSSVDMCAPFPAEVMIINAQPAYLYDVNLKIKIPSSGTGLSYVPGSATIEIEGLDAVNTPRSVGAAAESALVSASNNGDLYWNITLAQLDPTNYGNGEPFSGTLNSSNNEFILRWEMETTCDIISGDFFNLTTKGNDPCGTPAAGSGEQVNGPTININGVSAPYFSFITVGISPDHSVEGCDDAKTIDLELLLTSGTTGSTDTLKVVLPEGIGYNGGYVCNTPGKCPTYSGSSIINGEEVLTFKYPSGQTGSIDFSFDISTDSRGGCNTNDIIKFQSTTTVTGLVCGGGSCASTEVFTGNEEISLSIEKPILSVQFNSLIANTANTPYAYHYEIELLNEEKTYTYKDQLENFKSKVYYKLKQVDHDGSMYYSEVIQVELTDCKQQADQKIVIYPNPIKRGKTAYVTFENSIEENEVNVNVLSIKGVMMQTFPLMNITEGKNTFSLDLTTLPGGTYMVIIDQKYGKSLSGKMSVIKL